MAHGRIVIDAERCKGCELCRAACLPQVISLSDSLNSQGYQTAVLVDPDHLCTGCALCAVVCPDVCITVYRMVKREAGRTMINKVTKEYMKIVS